jgi:hypothetical protein
VFLVDEAQSLNMGSEERPMNTKSDAYQANREDENIERILESAVVLNWDDLMGVGQSGLVHIEYAFAPGGTLDCVQVWSCIKRGYWLLACTYSMSASQSHGAGVHFANEFESEGLAHILEIVMQNQNVFTLPHNLGRQGLLQIATPTENERKAAAVSVNDAFNRLNRLSKHLLPTEGKPPLPLSA